MRRFYFSMPDIDGKLWRFWISCSVRKVWSINSKFFPFSPPGFVPYLLHLHNHGPNSSAFSSADTHHGFLVLCHILFPICAFQDCSQNFFNGFRIRYQLGRCGAEKCLCSGYFFCKFPQNNGVPTLILRAEKRFCE